MTEATVESQRPVFRWWGERVRIVIAPERREPRARQRPEPPAQGTHAREVAG